MPVDREFGPPYIANPVTGNKHNMSRALRIVSRNQGWNPDDIVDLSTGQVVGNIANFNKDPDVMWHDGTGTLPDGIPDSYPSASEPLVENGMDWNSPADSTGNDPVRHTKNADPFPGMPGA
jgi:hypothetical protein